MVPVTGWCGKTAAMTQVRSSPGSTATYATVATHPSSSSMLSRLRAAPAKSGAMVPVYVGVGLIALQVAFGIHTAYNLFRNAPSVRLSKKMRETVAEVEHPEKVVEEAERFSGKSFFRKVAHVQDFDWQEVMADPIRKDAYAYDHRPRAETLKSVGGVESKLHA